MQKWKKIILWSFLAVVAFLTLDVGRYFFYPDVAGLQKNRPGKTAFMEYREEIWKEKGINRKISVSWVPLSKVFDSRIRLRTAELAMRIRRVGEDIRDTAALRWAKYKKKGGPLSGERDPGLDETSNVVYGSTVPKLRKRYEARWLTTGRPVPLVCRIQTTSLVPGRKVV